MITAPKGTRDLYGGEAASRRRLENEIHSLCEAFGYGEIRIPVFEAEELFRRGVGETTDVVSKEMFTFTDKGGRLNALRPEGTAGVVRAYNERGMGSLTQPVKMYYISELFRQEKPQAGRYRQYSSFGVEVLGSGAPSADAEVISVAYELARRLGLINAKLHINSLGCPDCRPNHGRALKEFLSGNLNSLCATCRERFTKNPMRILDCKEESCKKLLSGAPETLNFLCGNCAGHFGELRALLAAYEIPYEIDPKIVRGLDYYTRTVFELIYEDEDTAELLGAQNVICGGGRYDGLSKAIGGADVPAVGFGLGMERLALILGSLNSPVTKITEPVCDIFIGGIGEAGCMAAQKTVLELRQKNIRAAGDISGRSVKAQMKYADKLCARYSAIIGDDEIAAGVCKLKDMQTGETAEVRIGEIGEAIKRV